MPISDVQPIYSSSHSSFLEQKYRPVLKAFWFRCRPRGVGELVGKSASNRLSHRVSISADIPVLLLLSHVFNIFSIYCGRER